MAPVRYIDGRLPYFLDALGGCGVSQNSAPLVQAHGTPDMGVHVTAGLVSWLGDDFVVPASDLAIAAADATYHRRDLVVHDTFSGASSVLTGDLPAEGNFDPAYPAVGATLGNWVPLGGVFVVAGHTSITTGDLEALARGVRRPAARAYVPTLANLDNTTAPVNIASATIPANNMQPGDEIAVTIAGLYKNNTGGGVNYGYNLVWGASTYTLVSVGTYSLTSSASELRAVLDFRIMRIGSDLWVVTPGSTFQIATGATVVCAAPTFTASATLRIQLAYGTASANAYFHPQQALVTQRCTPT